MIGYKYTRCRRCQECLTTLFIEKGTWIVRPTTTEEGRMRASEALVLENKCKRYLPWPLRYIRPEGRWERVRETHSMYDPRFKYIENAQVIPEKFDTSDTVNGAGIHYYDSQQKVRADIL